MKSKIYSTILLYFTSASLSAQVSDSKFHLNRIGVKINKAENYFLLTSENVKELKAKLLTIIDVCTESKLALENAMNNPNYQVLINDNNYNESMTFIKLPKYSNDYRISELLQILSTHCYSIKNSKIENLSMKKGTSNIGEYVSLQNKISTPHLTYYSEAFFIAARNSHIILTINTNSFNINTQFINDIEYINNERLEILLNNAKEYISQDDLKSAERNTLEAIRLEPNNVQSYEIMAAINLKLKRFNAALNDANNILKFDSNSINGHLITGLALMNLGNLSESIKSFQTAQDYYAILQLSNIQNEYFASFAEMYRLIAESYVAFNDANSAIENYNLALELSIDSLSLGAIYFNKGMVYSSFLKNPKEALNCYSLAISNYPSVATKEKSESFYNRGLIKRAIEDIKGAISDYSAAIKLRPDYVKAFNNRGYAKMLLEDYRGAVTDFTETIKYDNYTTEFTSKAMGNRGVAKFSIGEDGCPDIKKSVELGNQNILKVYNEYCK